MECDYESDSTDFSDEDLLMRKRALHVEMPENFDPNKIPENGEEYLQQVMYEAKKCPAFKVASINSSKIKPPTQVQVMENCIKAPKSMLPSMSWQDESVEDFTKFRKFIFTKIEKSKSHKSQQTKADITEYLNDPPKLSTVATFSQEDKIKLFETILSQMNLIKKGETLSRIKGVWIYSLLATLDTPLCPDTCHILRELARKCSQIRSGLNSLSKESPEEDYVPLNLYICLISRFFRQLDLADEG